MKKLVKSLSVFVVLFVLAFVVVANVKADAPKLEVEGAQIRTSGNEGIRFVAELDTLEGVTERGFLVAKGEYSVEEMKEVGKKYTVSGKTYNMFSAVIYGIPEESYTQDLTVVAYYVTDGDPVYADASVTRNLTEVARAAYNKGDSSELVSAAVANAKVEYTDAEGKVEYLADLPTTIKKAGTYDLVQGEYASAITVATDNVTIQGPNAEVSGTNEARSDSLEATLTGVVTLATQVDNVTIQGLKFVGSSQIIGTKDSRTGTASASLYNHENLVIKNNVFDVELTSANNGVIELAGGKHSYEYKTQITGNLFEANNSASTSVVYVDNVDCFSIINNAFKNVSNDAIHINDTNRGLTGLTAKFNENSFENVSGNGIYVNWFAPGSAAQLIAEYNFDENVFNNVKNGINIVTCNNADVLKLISVSKNTFTGEITNGVIFGRTNSATIHKFEGNVFETVPSVAYFDATANASSAYPGDIAVNNNIYKLNGEVLSEVDETKIIGCARYEAQVTYYTVYYENHFAVATAFLTDFYNWLVEKNYVNPTEITLEAFLDSENDSYQFSGKWYDYIGCTGTAAVGTLYSYVSTADYMWPTGGDSSTVNEDYFVTSSAYIAKWGKLLDAVNVKYNKSWNRVWNDKLGGAYDLAKWICNYTAVSSTTAYNPEFQVFDYFMNSFDNVKKVYNAENCTIIEVPVKEGFIGSWNTKSDGTGETISELSTTEFKELVLYAIYKPVDAE